MWFLLVFILVGACSSPKKIISKKPDLLKECLYKDVGDWIDTSHNFDCISKIHHSVDSLLKQGNSPQALRVSRMGVVQYPFDDRLKNQFQKSLDVFQAVTQKLTNCEQIKERILYLRAVSPDSHFEVSHCPIPKETNRLIVDDITYLKANKKIEMSEFKNVSGQLKYAVKMNTENNFDNILFKGLESVDVIHKSTHFDVSDASDENNFTLKVHTKVLMDQKIDETCRELGEVYQYEDGQVFSCGIRHKTPLKLGKLDFDNLSRLHEEKALIHGFIPTNSVFSVVFHYPHKQKTYYYYDTPLDGDKYDKFDEATPELEGMKAPSGFLYSFKNLNALQVESLQGISFTFNRLLTFKTYSEANQRQLPPGSQWKAVVKNHSILQ